MYKVYGYGPQRHVKVTWLLNELRLPYEVVPGALEPESPERAAFLQKNPFGKVPVLESAEVVLWEAGAISCYLVDRHREPPLAPPAGTPARGLHDRWLFLSLTELEQPLWTLARLRFAIPPELAHENVKLIAKRDWGLQLDVLEPLLPKEGFLLGESFTAADITLAYTLNWGRLAKLLGPYPRAQAYLERCRARSTCTLPDDVKPST